MRERTTDANVNGTPEQKTQDSIEGFRHSEVRNNEAQKLAAEEINHLVEGVASGTSPTESIQRYKDAVKKALERDYLEFLYAQSMGSWKSWAYAEYLRKGLGFKDEDARRIEAEVYEEFGKTADAVDWDIFLNGTAEQRKALQDALAWEMYGEDPHGEDPHPLTQSESGGGTVTRPDVAHGSGTAAAVHDVKLDAPSANGAPKDYAEVRNIREGGDTFEDHECSQVVSLERERERSRNPDDVRHSGEL